MGWRIYYADGPQRFSSKDSTPESLPRDGVLGVVKYLYWATPTVWQRAILSGDDHYFFWRGEWFSNSDPRKEIERRYPGALIQRGKWTTSEEWFGVQAEMAAAKEAP